MMPMKTKTEESTKYSPFLVELVRIFDAEHVSNEYSDWMELDYEGCRIMVRRDTRFYSEDRYTVKTINPYNLIKTRTYEADSPEILASKMKEKFLPDVKVKMQQWKELNNKEIEKDLRRKNNLNKLEALLSKNKIDSIFRTEKDHEVELTFNDRGFNISIFVKEIEEVEKVIEGLKSKS